MRKPIFGICYGLQSLNVWRTGTLDQDLPDGRESRGGTKSYSRRTRCEIDPQSKLAAILRSAGALPARRRRLPCPVNSSHHQAADVFGDGLRLVAWCPEDEVKEAVEGTAPDHFVLGVQWHPERTYDDDAASRALFQRLRSAAAEWHKQLALKQQDFESVEQKQR